MPLVPPDSLSQTDGATNLLLASGTLDSRAAFTDVRLEDGRTVRLSTATLLQGEVLPEDAWNTTAEGVSAEPSQVVVPVIEERLRVEKRVVETGKVRLHKVTQEFEAQLDELLAVRTFDVERIILNQPVDAPPSVRQEGETTVYPIVEEQLVITRQLVLKEELRVTRRDTEWRDTRPITLRRETIEVEREPLQTGKGHPAAGRTGESQ